MSKKTLGLITLLITVSLFFFPASANIIGASTNRLFYADATYKTLCGARGKCESFGYTTSFVKTFQCIP